MSHPRVVGIQQWARHIDDEGGGGGGRKGRRADAKQSMINNDRCPRTLEGSIRFALVETTAAARLVPDSRDTAVDVQVSRYNIGQWPVKITPVHKMVS